MPVIHAAVLVALVLGAAPLAPPPSEAEIRRLAADLASDDTATWRKAVGALWRVGKPALPALRKAARDIDADVQLRARLVLSRFEWGIFPDTPRPVARAIDRFRDGDLNQQKAAIDDLLKLGKPGYQALQHALKRDTGKAIRDHAAYLFKTKSRVLARSLIASGDNEGAVEFLRTAVAAGSDDALRDLAAYWARAGQGAEQARALARDVEKGDANAIRLAAYYHRAKGDLAAARKAAGRARPANLPLLVGLICEMEDFKALKGIDLSAAGRNNPAQVALYHLAGDEAGADAALARISPTDTWSRGRALLYRDKPDEGVAAWQRGGGVAAARLLAYFGRGNEALALNGDAWLVAEQAAIAHQAGDKEAPRLLQKAIESALAARYNKDGLLAPVLKAGTQMGRREETFADVCKALDRIRPAVAPQGILYEISKADADAMAAIYDHLRVNRPALPPSAVVTMLRDCFEKRKAVKELEGIVSPMLEDKKTTPALQARWDAAVVRLCLALGKTKRAEELLREAVKLEHLEAEQRLADFLFERGDFRGAAGLYARVAEANTAEPKWLYLRGAALARAGDEKGKRLIERARLMLLGDEVGGYYLADALSKLKLAEDAAAVREQVLRVGPFVSIYVNNSASSLISYTAGKKQWRKTAKMYRLIHLNLTGSFIDNTSYLRVPGMIHQHEMQALIEEGKLDQALAHAKKAVEFMPLETRAVSEMVRALDRADRKKDGDALFAPVFARLKKACEQSPNSTTCLNRVAWVCARARRELPEAVKFAARAVELSPKSPGLHDTLAECHFQNGDAKAAIGAIKKALAVAPKDKYYQGQLKRFEKGDRDADLPGR